MKSSVKIYDGKHGCFLTINGYSIKIDKNSFYGISVFPFEFKPNNFNATEFDSIQSLRRFWKQYRILILNCIESKNAVDAKTFKKRSFLAHKNLVKKGEYLSARRLLRALIRNQKTITISINNNIDWILGNELCENKYKHIFIQ